MASNMRPQFKHPIVSAPRNADSLVWVTEEELTGSVKPDTGLRQISWRGLNVIVRSMISLDEMIKLTGLVMDQCWDGEAMRPELMDFQLRCAVITFYTNVNLPESAAEQYEYLYGTDLYESVLPCISKSQIKAIEESIRMYMNR